MEVSSALQRLEEYVSLVLPASFFADGTVYSRCLPDLPFIEVLYPWISRWDDIAERHRSSSLFLPFFKLLLVYHHHHFLVEDILFFSPFLHAQP
jgi:hypothetical protein